MASMTVENVEGGRLVRSPVAGRLVVGMKAVRIGKDFINHYFVPLDPPPDGSLTLVYVDYQASMEDCHSAFSLRLDPVTDAMAPGVGQVLSNDSGRFLKIQDPIKGAMSLGYVDLLNGEIRRRQEHGITGVFTLRLSLTGS
ncbi:MAG: hypothetical protein H7840_00750 [Alphaproteobacteria bacterium]